MTQPYYPDEGKDRRRNWYLDRRISMDTIVAVCGLALVIGGPILIWGRAIEGRVQVIEVKQDQQEKNQTDKEVLRREELAKLTNTIDKLDDKVTQLQINVGRLVPFGVSTTKH